MLVGVPTSLPTYKSSIVHPEGFLTTQTMYLRYAATHFMVDGVTLRKNSKLKYKRVLLGEVGHVYSFFMYVMCGRLASCLDGA